MLVSIAEDTIQNTDYRRVIQTIPGLFQLVLMSIPAGQDIPRKNTRIVYNLFE